MLLALAWVSVVWLATAALPAQVTHYSVKLIPDLDRQILRGEQQIEFQHDAGAVVWQKQKGLQIVSANCKGGEVTLEDNSVTVDLAAGGTHRLRFEYWVTEVRGLRWLDDGAGLFTTFDCDAWMVCDNSPGQKATLRLEIVLPASSGLRAVGPGRLSKRWRDQEGDHFVFEQSTPVQTYLFSFGVAKLEATVDGKLSTYAPTAGHGVSLSKAADAYDFFRGKASVDPINPEYAQVFLPLLPGKGLGQEAAGLALMSAEYLADLEGNDKVGLMAHEIAHQWWGALVGIRSWSDFWLNEGMAEFMTAVYMEQQQGRAVYDREVADWKQRMETLREEGKDRPLHWEEWKDARETLGRIPYVKGALFLDRLKTMLGEESFWQGIALYTSRHAHQLVDSRDFQRAMAEASGRDVASVFEEGVYH